MTRLDAGRNTSIFTYGFGSDAVNNSILQSIACSFNGIRFDIPASSSSSALLTTLRNYSTFLSQGINITEPIWTEPYEDAFGFGRLVTISMPVYYQENGITQILGVAGIDVRVSQFTSFNLN